MLESAHIGYITQRLNLSPEEAERFWPIYNQYAAELHQARANYRINKDELALDEATLAIKKNTASNSEGLLPQQGLTSFLVSKKTSQLS